MTTPKDLIPTKYEVIKLKSGTEVVGMTRDCGDVLEITLPMICQLSLVQRAHQEQTQYFIHMHL